MMFISKNLLFVFYREKIAFSCISWGCEIEKMDMACVILDLRGIVPELFLWLQECGISGYFMVCDPFIASFHIYSLLF
jgi:hypothetical protein